MIAGVAAMRATSVNLQILGGMVGARLVQLQGDKHEGIFACRTFSVDRVHNQFLGVCARRLVKMRRGGQ
jgi:hypothetical protein